MWDGPGLEAWLDSLGVLPKRAKFPGEIPEHTPGGRSTLNVVTILQVDKRFKLRLVVGKPMVA